MNKNSFYFKFKKKKNELYNIKRSNLFKIFNLRNNIFKTNVSEWEYRLIKTH